MTTKAKQGFGPGLAFFFLLAICMHCGACVGSAHGAGCDGYSHDKASDRRNCTPCHNPENDAWRGGTVKGPCEACHGHDAAYGGGNYYGTTRSHSTHTEDDANDQKGLHVNACSDCHVTDAYPCFSDNEPQDLAGTAKCNDCHSPEGGFDGVEDPYYGAKALWKSGPSGVDKWCAGCHDSVPSVVSKRTAPDICGDNVSYGYYQTAAHGSRTRGVERQSVRASRGECAHCHDHSLGQRGRPHGSLFAKVNPTSQRDNFCFQCHRGSGSVQIAGVTNKNYAARFGGGTPSFASIYDAFNPGRQGSSHSLAGIASFAFGRTHRTATGASWSLTNARNPCSACHNPHKAQEPFHSAHNAVRSPISRPGDHDSVWGDEAHERMDTYNYQAPYWSGGLTFEPAGDYTQDGSNLPDYNKFCTDCHNPLNTIWSQNLDRPLRRIDWSRNGDKHGGRNAAENEDTDFYDVEKPYSEAAKQNHYNYVLACTDCHEPHGSQAPYLLRLEVNGKSLKYTGSLDTFYAEYFCGACHEKNSYSHGSPCGTGTHPGSGSKFSRCHYHGPRSMCPKLTAKCF